MSLATTLPVRNPIRGSSGRWAVGSWSPAVLCVAVFVSFFAACGAPEVTNAQVASPSDTASMDAGAMLRCAQSPGIDPESLPRCCIGRGRARCLPAGLVPGRASMLSECLNGGLCVPDVIVRAGTSYVPPRCRSFGGLAGACVSRCVPTVAEQGDLLPRDICESDERCAPCYDPSDGNRSTGACEAADPCSDAGTAPPPPPIQCPYTGPPLLDPSNIPACDCAGTRCMPTGRVPAAQRTRLAACEGGFCVPEPYIRAANNYVPRRCTAFGGLVGGCVSRCVPGVAAQADVLTRDVCDDGELCAPCYDPEDGNQPTGACDVPPNCGDGGFPTQPPPLQCPHTGPDVINPSFLPACPCAGTHCMPASRVPDAQRGMLSSCAGGFCVPDDFIRAANNFVPPTCRPFGGMGEGRCLSRCVPMVASQAATLVQSTCNPTQLCVPCFDPRTGASTSACDQSCDPGPQQPPFRFQDCCGGRAKCVPTASIPAAQRGSLSAMSCPPDFLCAPNENLDPSFRPIACRASPVPIPILGQLPAYVGFCVSTCVNRSFFERLGTAQGSCAGGYFCAPCRTPFGAATGVPGCT